MQVKQVRSEEVLLKWTILGGIQELHRVEAFKCKQKCDHPTFESFASTIVALGVFQFDVSDFSLMIKN